MTLDPVDPNERFRDRRRRARRRRRIRRAAVAGLVCLVAAAVAQVAAGPAFRHRHAPSPAALLKAAAPNTPKLSPAARPTQLGRQKRPIAILMYHVIATPPRGALFPDLYVRPADFAGQMDWLARHAYQAVTLYEVYAFWRGEAALPARPIVLSFDDGYRSVYTHALPVLRALGWPGVLNLVVANLRRSWGLSPRMVRALLAAGWELDSHTLTHPDLTLVNQAQLEREVAGSRALLQRRFGVPVDFFSYPLGHYNDATLAAVRRAGYLGAITIRYGLAAPGDLFTLARVRVSANDGVAGVASKLQGLLR